MRVSVCVYAKPEKGNTAYIMCACAHTFVQAISSSLVTLSSRVCCVFDSIGCDEMKIEEKTIGQ